MDFFFAIYSKSEENTVQNIVLNLPNDIKNSLTLKPIEYQFDEQTKSDIIECKVFICFLSPSSSQLLLDIAKFALCIARKEINAYFMIDSEKFYKSREKVERNDDISFFKLKTTIFNSIENIKVKIF